MKIFEIRLSLDPKQIGSAHSNGLSMKEGYDYETPDSVYHWKSNKLKPNLDAVKIQNEAQITDFIKSVPLGGDLVLSKQLLALLQKFRMMPYEVYDTILIHRDKRHTDTHQMLSWTSDLTDDMIDFSRSRFFIPILDKNTGQEIKKPTLLSSIQQMKNAETINEPDRIIYSPAFEKIILSAAFQYEVFHLFYRQGMLISQQVKNRLEKASITGVRFEERNDIVFS